MSRRGSAALTTSSSSKYVDPSPHAGFVNLGNTCFLNSVLQATSATQSLKQLYHPDVLLDNSVSEIVRVHAEQAAAGTGSSLLSNEAAFAELVEQLSARSKSPVLQLVDGEHGRFKSYPTSRRASTVAADLSLSGSISQTPNATDAVLEPAASSARSSLDAKYEPTSNDLPLNTAFRQLLEKTWANEDRKAPSSSKSGPRKAPAVNPKRLLSIMASKYDQYGDYGQQDGHELLRHLLDSLRMEELDVIKRIRPPSPPGSKKRIRKVSTERDDKTEEGKLQPFVDSLFCGKLLSCVVCEGCRHVSHTYEDFYDVSLSLRPEVDAKNAVKRDRMRSMADRWKKATTTSKTVGGGVSNRAAHESVATLRDDLVGSVSDTEEVEQKINRTARALGGGISRPKSAAAGQNAAMMDANSRESAKAFMIKNLQPETGQSTLEVDLEKLSLQAEERKSSHGGAVALLRAVSNRSRSRTRNHSTSRGPSPIGEEINHLVDGEKSTTTPHHHHHHLHRHEHKPRQSRHGAYLAKLLTEAPPPTPLAPTSALLWGRRTPVPTTNEQSNEAAHGKAGEVVDIESQQANTGLVRALHQFTSVEVLDGANSFACKRCWRLMNPPSVEEEAKLRLRRLRRGKDEDESERSSDDEPSSDEGEKEKKQREEMFQSMTASNPSPSISSETDSIKASRPSVIPHADWTKTVTQETVRRQMVPSIEMTSPQSPTSNGDHNGAQTPSDTPPPPAPLLKAPKAITASAKGLTLGESLSSASSDEGLSDNPDDETEEKRTTASVKFNDQQKVNSRTSLPMARTLTTKRSTHSLQRRALKRFLIANTPRVFVFHFKRFQASSRGFTSYSFSNNFKKIDDYITFPEYLDVKPWLAPPREEYSRNGRLKESSDARALARALQDEGQMHERERKHGRWGWRSRNVGKLSQEADKLDAEKKTKYKLYAVIVHQGSMTGGHYTAYVLSDRINESGGKSRASESSSTTPTAAAPTTPSLDEGSKKMPSLTNLDHNSSLLKEASLRSSLSASSLGSEKGALSEGNSVVRAAESSGAEGNKTTSSKESLPVSEAEKTIESATGDRKISDASSNGSKTKEHDAPFLNGVVPPVPLLRSNEKKRDNRKWIYCSDTMVRGASVEEVLKAQAYMLFYEQM